MKRVQEPGIFEHSIESPAAFAGCDRQTMPRAAQLSQHFACSREQRRIGFSGPEVMAVTLDHVRVDLFADAGQHVSHRIVQPKTDDMARPF